MSDNMAISYLLVAGGGVGGAVCRYAVGKWFGSRISSDIPWGTLIVNLSGSLLLGLIAGARMGSDYALLLGTGFLGAFTTFSTFKQENIRLLKAGKLGTMVGYLSLSYTIGLLAAYGGYLLGQSFIL